MKKILLPSILLLSALFLIACGPPPAPAGSEVRIDDGTPQNGDYLEAHIVGTLEDGTSFVNTYEMGAPMVFPFGQQVIIPGWDGMFADLEIGETASYTLPPEEAFGEAGLGQAGTPGHIPPGSTINFDVELVSILFVDYQETESGSGPLAQEGDIVSVHYTGTLEDGTVFDSSLDRGEPIQFMLGQGQVIPGWEIGIQKMNVGSKATLTIPSALAYGPQGRPPTIPPNATLIFDVELVEIEGGQ